MILDLTRRVFLAPGDMISPWQVRRLEGYQRRWFPKELLTMLENEKISHEKRELSLFKWYYTFAIEILKGYQDCRVPFGGHEAVEVHKTPVNLLSEKGEKQLKKLMAFQKKIEQIKTVREAEDLWEIGEDRRGIVETLLSVTTPAYFDLSLYKDFTPIFKKINKLTSGWGTGWEASAQNSFSITSGCKNCCPHCGIEAVAPQGIFSMPYPLKKQFSELNLIHSVYVEDMMGCYSYETYPWRCYNASDPIDWYDPVMKLSGPEKGDCKLGTVCLTKGINPRILKDSTRRDYSQEMKKYDALCYCRDTGVPVKLSVVSFGYEDLSNPKVIERLKENRAVFNGEIPTMFMVSDTQKKGLEALKKPGDEQHGISAEGRAISYGQCDGSGYGYNQITVEADGSVYVLLRKVYKDTKYQGIRYAWHTLGNFITTPKKLEDNIDYLLSLETFAERRSAMSEDTERFPWVRPAFLNPSLTDEVIKEFPPLLPRVVSIQPLVNKEKVSEKH